MFDTRPIIVTGASRGVGLELTRQLIASGQSVVGIVRHPPSLPSSEEFSFIECDLSDIAAVAHLTNRLRHLRPRGLINNAAVQTEADWMEVEPGELASCFVSEINLDLVAPLILGYGLIREIAGAQQGFVCNVNSALALAPKMSSPAYCAAKAALSNATLTFRGRARSWPHVLVNESFLPMVDTDMTTGRGRGKISAQAAATAILRGLNRRQAETWVGQTRMLRFKWRLAPFRVRHLLLGPHPQAEIEPTARPSQS